MNGSLRSAGACASVLEAPVRRANLTHLAPVALAAAGVALAVAIAAGAIAVPDLAGALSDATDSIGGWVYLAVPALVFVETTALAGFVIHGELALVAGGVAAERGDASLAVLIALTWAAAVAGDSLSLLLGRRLGRPFLERHGARFGAHGERLARVESFFARHGGRALLIGRFTGFTRAVLPFVAGSSGLRLRQLLPYSAASGLVWTAVFIAIGYAFSESFAEAGDTATRVTLVAVLVVAAVYLATARLRRAA
jgi:membrane protein DedA with SNARE-associated domain